MNDFTIFLVDDDKTVLQGLSRLLQAAGYQIKTFSSAKTFLHEHDASIPGCVLLDMKMPDLSGLDVQEALARQGISRPIIFLTGSEDVSQREQAIKAGATDFLRKPIKKSELLRAINSAEARDRANPRFVAVR